MLKQHQRIQVRNMLQEGVPVAEIGQRMGFSLATIYKYKKVFDQPITAEELIATPSAPHAIAPYQSLVDYHIKKRDLKPLAVLLTIQQAGYEGSQSTFERYYRQRKQELRPQKYLRHLETEKGEQAQVDWGHFGVMTINGKPEKVYLFALILSWSRAVYLEFVVHQNQRTLQICHIHAFEKLGIPKIILYDNMKTVVNRREKLEDGTKKIHYNVAFMDFARYYQFKPEACAPYWPQAKGKIERTIKYVREYFPRISPTVSLTLEELNTRLQEWVDTQANQRIHETTRQKPYDLWLQEKPDLAFSNLPIYITTPLQTCYAKQFGLMVYNTNTYNLGPEYALLKLEVREVQDHGLPILEIYRQGTLIMTLPVPAKKHSWVTIPQTINQPNKLPTLKGTSKLVRQKKIRSYDIEVEQRDLGYYNLKYSTLGEA